MAKKHTSATLTDLKNKIGEVLAVADQHGSVQITSYGRVKYEIRRVFGEEASPTLKESIKKPTAPAYRQEAKPEKAEIEDAKVEPAIEVAPQPVIMESPFAPEPVKPEEPVIAVAPKKLWTDVALFPGFQAWERNSKHEHDFANHARNLVLTN